MHDMKDGCFTQHKTPALRAAFGAKGRWGTASRAKASISRSSSMFATSFFTQNGRSARLYPSLRLREQGTRAACSLGLRPHGQWGTLALPGRTSPGRSRPTTPPREQGRPGDRGAAPGGSRLRGAGPRQARPWARVSGAWAGRVCGELESSAPGRRGGRDRQPRAGPTWGLDWRGDRAHMGTGPTWGPGRGWWGEALRGGQGQPGLLMPLGPWPPACVLSL